MPGLAELEHFARYRLQRERIAPGACHLGAQCWVMEGPPALGVKCGCKGCGGFPLTEAQRVKR